MEENLVASKTKTDLINISHAVDLDQMKTDSTTNNAKKSYPSADQTKVAYLSVTQAVNLDSLESTAADNQVKSTNFIQDDGKSISSDEIKARDSGGLKLNNQAGTAGMLVDDYGNIVISVTPVATSPSSKLHINGDLSLTDDNTAIMFNTYYNTAWKGYSTGYCGALKGSNDGKMYLYWNSVTANTTYTPSSRLTIDSNGLVGIGTNSPETLLHLKSQNPSLLVMEADTDASGRGDAFLRISLGGAGKDKAQVWFENGGTPIWHMGTTYNNGNTSSNFHISQSSYYNNGGASVVPELTITTAGNVGIGVWSPAHKLDIAGDVNTSDCFKESGSGVAGTCSSDARLKKISAISPAFLL